MYKIIGVDQKEYGPISLEQMRQWITEGRLNGQTPVQAEGETGWKPLASMPEFAGSFASAPPPPLGSSGGPVFQDTGGAANAQRLVNGPAIALIVIAAIGIVLQLLGIVVALAGTGLRQPTMPGMDPELARFMQFASGPLSIIFKIIAIAGGAFVLYGAIKMKKLESYGLAMAASIIAMLPVISPCCCLGIPFGIWALVVLSKPEVKNQFS